MRRSSHDRTRALWVGTAMVVVGACNPIKVARTEGEVAMSFANVEYWNNDLPSAPQQLTVHADGRVRYESHSNWGALDRPELGVYETTLGGGELASLAQLVAMPTFAGLPDHWGKVDSGEHFRRIRVTSPGSTSEKLVGTRTPIDPGLQRVFGELDRIVELVVAHPGRVVRSEIEHLVVGTEGTVTLDLRLRALGTGPVRMRSPIDLTSGESGWITVTAWPDPPPPGAVATTASIIAVTPFDPPEPTGHEPSVVELRPGESARFRVRATLSSTPRGPIAVRVTLANFLPEVAQHDVLVGEVSTTTTTVVP